MIADRSTTSARATSHPQTLTPDLQRCIRNRLPVQNRLPPPSETQLSRQYPVRSPSPTASDAHRHRLRRHGPAGPDDIAHDLVSRRRPPILQSNRGIMPDTILELAFDHSKIRHRDRPPNNTPIFAIDSLPSSHTTGRQPVSDAPRPHSAQIQSTAGIGPQTVPIDPTTPAAHMSPRPGSARQPTPRGPHLTHLACQHTRPTQSVPRWPSGHRAGPQPWHTRIENRPGTRFFLRTPAPQRTRTPLREKRLVCDHPQHLKQNSGADFLPKLNPSHFPVCAAWAATPPYYVCPLHVRPHTHTHQVTFIPDAICRISFRIAKPTRLGPA